jgi:Ca-activated chloride channel family protein
MEFKFAYSFVFTIVGLLALIILAGIWWRWKRKKVLAIQIPFLVDLTKAQNSAKFWNFPKLLNWGKWITFSIAIILITIALARPQAISKSTKVSKNGVDILIALDVSESMLAEDLQPNRIEAAKKYIDQFVSELKNDRVGLEVFAGKPFTQSPLSFDYNVVRYYLAEISTDTINQQYRGLGGTAIGDAIVAAINRFKNNPDRTKVLVLLTDGEANVGVDPIFATEHARSKGIKIYTIGLGKKEGAPVKITDAFGRETYARNPDGTIYKTKFDEETLQNIAKISGGSYFYAGDNDALQKSLETINNLEKTEYEAETSVTKEDRFWNYLFAGFLMAVVSSAILFFKRSEK